MSEHDSGQEKTFDATPRKLEQARRRGDVPISREGASAGVYLAALLAVVLTGNLVARQIGDLVLPLIEQPEAFLDATQDGLTAAGKAMASAVAVALLPVFGMLVAGALVPHLLQNSVAVSLDRIAPNLANLSPRKGFKRIFGAKAMFEFAKSIVKLLAVGVACLIVAWPIYAGSIRMVSLDFGAFPALLSDGVVSLLLAITLVAMAIAGIDVPYQHWEYRRRQRMTMQEMREEARATEGDPHIKAKLKQMRRQRSQARMLRDVPKASVVVANPTHFAVALRYERGQDAAPIVVAKGVDHMAMRIKDLARRHEVAVVEDPPLARALHAAVDVGDMIPREHFEAVARIIGVIWAQRAGMRK